MEVYRDLNDYELMYMIEENDDAKDMLFDKYRPIIVNMARKYLLEGKKVGLELDDLIQEGYIGLYAAIRNYNPDHSSLFYTYAILSINSKILNALKKSSTQKRETLNHSISLSKPISIDSETTFIDLLVDDNSLLPDMLIEEKELSKIVSDYLYSLDIDVASILELSINGFNNVDIGKMLGYSSKYISNVLFRVRRKLHQLL